LTAAAPVGGVLLDTDAFSLLQTQDPRAVPLAAVVAGRIPLLSFVTVGELLRGAEQAGWGAKRRTALDQRIANATVLPYDGLVVVKYAEITADAKKKGHPLGQPVHSNDAWIAATAVAHGVPLVTGNHRHFAGAKDLTVLP
jgi:predicted nucleic acid-binding protein